MVSALQVSRNMPQARRNPMTDVLQLLHESLPFVIMALLFAAFWRLTNATVTLQWAAKTQAPEPSKYTVAGLKRDLQEARANAEDMRYRLEQAERDEARRIA